eukprot:1514432-Amphidinium_carterae.1
MAALYVLMARANHSCNPSCGLAASDDGAHSQLGLGSLSLQNGVSQVANPVRVEGNNLKLVSGVLHQLKCLISADYVTTLMYSGGLDNRMTCRAEQLQC